MFFALLNLKYLRYYHIGIRGKKLKNYHYSSTRVPWCGAGAGAGGDEEGGREGGGRGGGGGGVGGEVDEDYNARAW